jgi:GntR family transcriptional repressor for pyruvate dehydrogenase complex
MHRALQAQDVEAEAQADTEFHALLAVASHNLMLSHHHASVIALLRENIMTNTFDASLIDVNPKRFAFARFDQHKAIFQAIPMRRPDIAFEEMHNHIKFVAADFGATL